MSGLRVAEFIVTKVNCAIILFVAVAVSGLDLYNYFDPSFASRHDYVINLIVNLATGAYVFLWIVVFVLSMTSLPIEKRRDLGWGQIGFNLTIVIEVVSFAVDDYRLFPFAIMFTGTFAILVYATAKRHDEESKPLM